MTTLLRWLMMLALLAAACGDSSAPTTSQAPTTVPPVTGSSTAPTTIPGTTTTPPLPAAAVHMYNCVVGVGPGGDWLQTPGALAPHQPFADTYRSIVVDTVTETFAGTVQTDVSEDFAEFSFTEGAVLGFVDYPGRPDFTDELLVGGAWDPTPRTVTATDPESATYRDFTAEVLDGLGLDFAPDNRAVIRFDIEGDGREEVLVYATSVTDDTPFDVPGYSLLYLRRLAADDSVETTIIDSSSGDDRFSVISYEVAGVFDANGDGNLELAFDWAAFESGGKLLYEFDGSGYRRVANCGSGV